MLTPNWLCMVIMPWHFPLGEASAGRLGGVLVGQVCEDGRVKCEKTGRDKMTPSSKLSSSV